MTTEKLIRSLSMCAVAAFVFSSCSSSTSSPDLDETPPPVPTGLAISQIGNGSVTLTWSAVSDNGLNGYNVYWLGGTTVEKANANTKFFNSTTAIITGLDYDILYYFAVSAVDGSNNESALSVQLSGIPFNTTNPSPPADVDLVAENIDYPKVTLFWEDNIEPDIAEYRVYRATDTVSLTDSTSLLAIVTQPSYIDASVDIGKSYYYSVTAIDKGDWESPRSAIVSDYVLPPVTLTTPLDFSYVSKNPTLEWESVIGASLYKVIITSSRIGGEIWTMEVDKNTTQITYNGKTKLINGNTYYWKVGAISRTEINSVSAIGSFVVKTQ